MSLPLYLPLGRGFHSHPFPNQRQSAAAVCKLNIGLSSCEIFGSHQRSHDSCLSKDLTRYFLESCPCPCVHVSCVTERLHRRRCSLQCMGFQSDQIKAARKFLTRVSIQMWFSTVRPSVFRFPIATLRQIRASRHSLD